MLALLLALVIDEGHEGANVTLVSAPGLGAIQVGEPLDFGGNLGQSLELRVAERPLGMQLKRMQFFQRSPQKQDNKSTWTSIKQVGMGARAYKYNQALLVAVIEFVSKKKVAANMALPVPCPLSSQGVVPPFGAQWGGIGNQQYHGFLEPIQVIPA
jgi:hypothetical protein